MRIDEEDDIARVGDDLGDLIGEEPGIDGVAHASRSRGGEIDFEVPRAVPRQRSDPVALAEPETIERPGEPPAGDASSA